MYESNAAQRRRRQIQPMQLILAGTATVAVLFVYNATQPGTAETVATSGSVHLVDQAAGLAAPATAPSGPRLPQTPPNLAGGQGNIPVDNSDDDDQNERNQMAQQSEEEWDDYFAQDEDPNVNNPNNPDNP
jgi:hypothetical protein